MTVITIDNASFCHGLEVAKAVAERVDLPLIEDRNVFDLAAQKSNVAASDFNRLVYGPPKLWDRLKEARPVLVAELRLALARLLKRDNFVLCGNSFYLVPESVPHVLRVCLIGNREERIAVAGGEQIPQKQAEQTIKQSDESRALFTDLILGREPWDHRLFDLVLPIRNWSLENAVSSVIENAGKQAVETTLMALKALEDFTHSAYVQLEFAKQGYDVDVISIEGNVEILIKKHTLFLERMQRQLAKIASNLEGVKQASARPGPRYEQANIYVNLKELSKSRVLLVDDEKAFVETLSARLRTRDIESSVAYGGAEALSKIEKDEPEVMVLDLKMPGIDGLEVLRRVKANNPKTEVIILTAHGTEAEEELVFQMGAFAYLRKPVDIEELTSTMQLAYRKMRENQQRDDEG